MKPIRFKCYKDCKKTLIRPVLGSGQGVRLKVCVNCSCYFDEDGFRVKCDFNQSKYWDFME